MSPPFRKSTLPFCRIFLKIHLPFLSPSAFSIFFPICRLQLFPYIPNLSLPDSSLFSYFIVSFRQKNAPFLSQRTSQSVATNFISSFRLSSFFVAQTFPICRFNPTKTCSFFVAKRISPSLSCSNPLHILPRRIGSFLPSPHFYFFCIFLFISYLLPLFSTNSSF